MSIVYISMSRIRQLRQEYRETWKMLSQELGELQDLLSSPVRDYPVIENALTAVQAARKAHNDVRDGLALALTASSGVVQFRYASSSINSTVAPAKTEPSLITRA